jgi:serine/threonine-protein kinase
VIHRDVKPQNVLLDAETGRAMVTDFGIASVADAADRPSPTEPLTHQGMVMGTPRYMSPEQASGQRDLTPASDLYALGVVLYEMLTGAYPYKVSEPPNYMLAHLTQAPIPMVTRVGDMPRDVDRLVQRLLEKAPADRYATAEALITAIDALGGSTEALVAPRHPVTRLARRARRAAGIVAVALIGVLGARAWRHTAQASASPDDPRRSVLIGFFENNTPDRNLDWLRIGGVEYLAGSLARWKDLRLVGAEQLLDLARRQGIADGAPLSQEDAVRLARRARVGTATTGSILRLGDRLRLTVRVYDAETGRLLRTATAEAANDSTVTLAFGQLASQILDLAGAPPSALDAAEPPTASLTAYRAYVDGVAARSRWNIPAAAEAFERAVHADSTFALAYYELSQARFTLGEGLRDTTYAALADAAARWAESRPTRERLLIQAYRAYVRADLPQARELYQRVLAIDSTLPEALAGLGNVQQLDRTLRPNGHGGYVLPLNLTAALRNYERALALNSSDHRNYANLAQVLAFASLDEGAEIAAYREPPAEPVFSALFLRSPVKHYSALLVRDSFVVVDADSLRFRYAAATVDSLRRAARARALAVVRQWSAVAPTEGQPFAIESALRLFDHDYDGALAALATAQRLGASSPVPWPLLKLEYLLRAQRMAPALALVDSIRRGQLPVTSTHDLPLGQLELIAGYLAGGHLKEGAATAARLLQELREAGASTNLQRRLDVSDVTMPLRLDAITGRATIAAVRVAEGRIEQVIAAAADSDRSQIRNGAANAMVFAAATVGDTATVRSWDRYTGFDYSPEVAAWAAVNAGDQPRAARLLAAMPRDTAHSPVAIYARAQVLRALGRRPEALHTLARMDSADYGAGPVLNVYWVLRVRAVGERAALAEALGDTASARRDYATFITWWKDADPPLSAERDRAAAALRDLDGGGRRDRGGT